MRRSIRKLTVDVFCCSLNPRSKNPDPRVARGSLEETKYHLLLAKDLDYISKDDFKDLAKSYNDVGKMLNGLINSFEDKNNG